MKYVSVETLEKILKGLYDRMDVLDKKAEKEGLYFDRDFDPYGLGYTEMRDILDSNTDLLRDIIEEAESDRDVYYKIQHDFLLEDARNFVADHLECDEDDEQLEKYDYEYLVSEYERRQDCNVAFNDTWWSIVEEYMEEQDGWQSVGFYGHDENGNLTHWEK